MDIQVGDRVTYKESIDQFELKHESIINSNTILLSIERRIKDKEIEILKIERPIYEVIEEKKELLTKEEKEFLKSYIKLIESLNNGEVTHISRYNITITVYLRTGLSYDTEVGPRFENMIEDENYPIESLGLE